MTPRDLIEVLDQLQRGRGERALCLDYGVRCYLLDLLRAQLPHQREEVVT